MITVTIYPGKGQPPAVFQSPKSNGFGFPHGWPHFVSITGFGDGALPWKADIHITFDPVPVYITDIAGHLCFWPSRPLAGDIVWSYEPGHVHNLSSPESKCCGAPEIEESGRCNRCKEHAEFIQACIDCDYIEEKVAA